MIALLEPLFQGDHARHGEALQCAPQPPADALRVADLIAQPPLLLDLLHRQARHLGADTRDLRPVASAWSLEYLGMWLPPMVAAASVLQHAFPADPEHVWVRFDDDGDPLGFHIRELGRPMPGTSAAQRYAPMFWQHMAPLFAVIGQLTRLAPKVLWSNAARHLETILEEALALTGGAAPIAQDRDRLLRDATWPQPQRTHPLYAPQRQVELQAPVRPTPEGRRETLTLYRHCCLNHLLPGESHCGPCPLAPAHRKGRAEAQDA
ncbi:siderophore-iron reductase FhuF [Variovorax sp. J22G73]|jgi:ferric iron reductase protein FhuF|uniref:siderophore-iron reductase FhuF n=1 Tax=unclassified Variovorax TaxID=663243 RepID=UPI000D5CE110|nr:MULTISPECIES: siderophore-iron reductase FhuF [unclassified Variovorax]MDM0009690.1 siderophore-iron reductase FhuF [Variovorax sp. J22R203]MDM0102198.1 siderophore-iron reductase FhuF [Variovorax sp. J22G73]